MQRFQTAGEQKVIDLKQETTAPAAAKKQTRCRHFPNCQKSPEECPYVHPSENCKYFPACTNGEKCIYLHPEIECKFGLTCSRQNCAYKHPKGRVAGGGKPQNMMAAMMQMMMGGVATKPRPPYKKKPID